MMIATLIAAGIAAGAAIVNLVYGFQLNTKLEQVRSQLDLQLHVHKVRFEKEFEVLAEVWGRLIELRNAGEAFKPGFKSGPSDPDEDWKCFVGAYNNLLRVIDARKPFFPPEVFDLLEEYRIRQLKYAQGYQFITEPDFQKEWVSDEFWKNREKHPQDIEQLVEQVCEAIRRRVAGEELDPKQSTALDSK